MFRLPKILLSSDHPDNPWGSPRAPRGSSIPPFGERQQRGGGTPPPKMPPFFKNFGDGKKTPADFIGVGIVVVILLWIASGLYRVQPEENGVVLRFGKYMDTVTEAGLHYHLPWPVETVLTPNVTFERRIEIGYRALPYAGSEKQDIPEESMILTGDANIVDLDFVVQWKVSDAKNFLFNIRDPEATLKRVAESAMREVVGQNRLQDIITDRREDIAVRVKPMMQEILDAYGAGIMVTQVLIQDASVPHPVLDAFEDVIRATQQAETLKNQAQRYRNEIVPRAQGEAIRLVKEAEAYKEQVVSQAKGDAQRFNDVYSAYASAKDVTRERLYFDAWDHVLRNSDAIILDSAKSGSVPYVDLNALRRKPDTAEENR